MNLSNSQFGEYIGHDPEQHKPSGKSRSISPQVSQFLNIAIKQERLRKLQKQNKEINKRAIELN